MSFVTPPIRTGSSDPEERAGCGEVLLVCGDLGGGRSLLGFEGRDARGSAYERQKAAFLICLWEIMGGGVGNDGTDLGVFWEIWGNRDESESKSWE